MTLFFQEKDSKQWSKKFGCSISVGVPDSVGVFSESGASFGSKFGVYGILGSRAMEGRSSSSSSSGSECGQPDSSSWGAGGEGEEEEGGVVLPSSTSDSSSSAASSSKASSSKGEWVFVYIQTGVCCVRCVCVPAAKLGLSVGVFIEE